MLAPWIMKIPVAVFGASLFIATVGFADDVKSIPVLPRLVLQAFAVGAIVFTASPDLRIVPACPLWIERGLLLLAGLWFVNLVNFMDGLDWMTVAEVVPFTGAMVVLGLLGELSLSVDHRRRGSGRRDDRICTVQSPGSENLPWRRGQSADWVAARLVLFWNYSIATTSRPHFCCRSIIWLTPR